MFSYNTSYHSTTHTTPYELLYGMKPRTPSLPAADIQRKFYGESFASERLQILQKAREIAKQNIEDSQAKYKAQHDKGAQPHDFSIGQQVWYSQTDFLNVNRKLAPKWLGPATIIEINESVAKLKLANNRHKTFNVKRLKHFFSDSTDQLSTEDADQLSTEDARQTSTDADQKFDASTFDAPPSRPRTRAWAKLIKSDAASLLIEKDIWYKLNSIAHKLYHLNLSFQQLTAQEQQFWSSFQLRDIFEYLTGDPERPPDYQEYITVRSAPAPNQNIQHHPGPQPQAGEQPQQPPHQPPQEGSSGTAPKRGRPLGSKNKPKDAFSRLAHYASKRITRATSGSLLPKP